MPLLCPAKMLKIDLVNGQRQNGFGPIFAGLDPRSRAILQTNTRLQTHERMDGWMEPFWAVKYPDLSCSCCHLKRRPRLHRQRGRVVEAEVFRSVHTELHSVAGFCSAQPAGKQYSKSWNHTWKIRGKKTNKLAISSLTLVIIWYTLVCNESLRTENTLNWKC